MTGVQTCALPIFTGFHVLTTLLETRVDYDADLIEDLTREITELSSHLKSEEDVDNAILIAIKELQERTMIIREKVSRSFW